MNREMRAAIWAVAVTLLAASASAGAAIQEQVIQPWASAAAPEPGEVAEANSIAAMLTESLMAPFARPSPRDAAERAQDDDYLPGWMREVADRHNLQLSLNTDFVLGLGDAREKKHEDLENFYVREFELAFGAELTPDIWFDIFYNIEREPGEDEIEDDIEEVFLTFLNLPGGLQAKAGRMYPPLGKANQYHTHARPWVDRPLAVTALLGEEQLRGYGVSVNGLVPNPWDVYSELTLELFDPITGQELGGAGLDGESVLAHWKNVFVLSDATSLEAGVTGALIGQENGHTAETLAADLTVKWLPPEESLYKSLTWQTEVYHVRVDRSRPGMGERQAKENLWGAYTSLEWQFARRLFGGLRLDWVEAAEAAENPFAFVPFLTFRQTERMFWRLQYNYGVDDPEEGRTHAFFLQFNYSFGKHRAHVY